MNSYFLQINLAFYCSHLLQTIDIVDIVAGDHQATFTLQLPPAVLLIYFSLSVAHVPLAPTGIKDWNHRSVVLTDDRGRTKALAYVLARDKYIR